MLNRKLNHRSNNSQAEVTAEARPILFPLSFSIAWIVGLVESPNDPLRIFAIVDLSLNLLTLTTQWLLEATLAYKLYGASGFILAIYGWVAFSQANNNLDPIGMYSKLGPGYWLTLSVLQRIAYFQLLLKLAALIFAAFLAIVALIGRAFWTVLKKTTSEEGLADPAIPLEDRRDRYQGLISMTSLSSLEFPLRSPTTLFRSVPRVILPVPLESSVSDHLIQPFPLSNELCPVCNLTLDDHSSFMPCNHAFHRKCRPLNCPICSISTIVTIPENLAH